MATPIAELFVSVSADVSQALTGLTSVNDQINKTSNAFSQAVPAAIAFEAAGGAIGASLAGAVNVAADFQQEMANVRSVMSPAEANQFGEALSQLAIRLGRDTVFTSQQAAQGIEELIKAGIPAKDVINGAADAAINLAAATGVPVADAAAIAAQAMNAFGHSSQQLTADADVLTGVVNASAASMSDLKFGLQVVGPTAQTVGLSFADTAQAIGLLTNAGETGATAGTGLRQMLLELTPTTKPAQEEMKKLGLVTASGANVFFDATGKIKDLSQISQILADATKGMSDQQRLAAFNILFTRDAINSASILARDGAKGVNQLRDAMKGITAEDTAEQRLNTFNGAIQNLQGSVETVQIIVGNVFLGTLTDLATKAKNVADAFANLDPTVQRGVAIFAAISAAVLIGLGAFILFAPAIAAVGPAIAAVGIAIGSVAPVFAAVAAAVFLLSQAWERNAGNIQRFSPVFESIPGLLQQAFSGDIKGAVDNFLTAIGAVSPRVAAIFNAIRTTVSNLVANIQPILAILGAAFNQAFSGNFGDSLDILQGLIGTFSPQLAGLVSVAREVASAIGDTLGTAFTNLGGFLTENAPKIATLAQEIMPQLADKAVEIAGTLRDEFLQGLQNAQAFIDGPLTAAFQSTVAFIQDPLIPTIIALKDTFTQVVVPEAIDFFGNIGNTLQNLNTSVQSSEQIHTFFQSLGAELSGFGTQVASLGPLFESLTSFFVALGNLSTALLNLQTAIASNIFSALGDQIAAFAAVAGPAAPAVEAVGTSIATIGQQLQGVTDFFTNAATAINNLANAINNFSKLPQINLPGGLNVSNPAFQPDQNQGQAGLFHSALIPGQQQGAGVVLNFNAPVSLNGTGDLTDFGQAIANAIFGSAKRVAPPVDNSAHPALAANG